jgi:hypothetical protein
MNGTISRAIVRLERAIVMTAALTVASAVGAQSTIPESSKIIKEVMRACHAHTTTEVMIFVSLTPMGRVAPTADDETRYIADPKHFEQAQKASSCWTRNRWERYIHAVATERRATYGGK